MRDNLSMYSPRAVQPPLTVGEVLGLPVLADARPEVIVDDGIGRQPVRWVHTSEIYEIAPLLKGGELLLTTGLGLVGVAASGRDAYVEALASRGVAALVVELGRTFTELPPDLIVSARQHRLNLVVLHGVVPFIEVTEVVHARLVELEVYSLRAYRDAVARLVDVVTRGEGLDAMTQVLEEECEVAVRAHHGTPESVPEDAELVDVAYGGDRVGTVVLSGPLSAGCRALVETAVPFIATELIRGRGPSHSRHLAGARLLRDVVAGDYGLPKELDGRLHDLGFQRRAGEQLAGLRVQVDSGRTAALAPLARDLAIASFGSALVHGHEDAIDMVVPVGPRDLRARVHAFADDVRDALLDAGAGRVRLACGPLVDELAGTARSLELAGSSLDIAARLTPELTWMLAEDFALFQMLVDTVGEAGLERLVAERLGPLLDHDARTGSSLVRTLDAYLAAGLSKALAAEILGVRRQTLYGRLERIAAVLGDVDLAQRETRLALDLALVSWRLRAAAATRARPRRHRNGDVSTNVHGG
jgi:PucR family transcriptional regulator, purine catabolism regulatory protein